MPAVVTLSSCIMGPASRSAAGIDLLSLSMVVATWMLGINRFAYETLGKVVRHWGSNDLPCCDVSQGPLIGLWNNRSG